MKEKFNINYGSRHFIVNFLLLVFIVLFINSCECVPDINTPKKITPTEYSKILFLNCSNFYRDLKIESDEISLIANLNYGIFNDEYTKCWSGSSFLRITDNSIESSVLNMPLNLQKDNNYTMVLFTIGSKLKSLVSLDSIDILNRTNSSYFRIINAIENNPRILIKIENENNSILELNNINNMISNYYSINQGKYKIKVFNTTDNSLIKEIEVNFEFNSIYNLIIYGDLNNTISKPLNIYYQKSNKQQN